MRLILFPALLTAAAAFLWAGDAAIDRATLRGLKAVNVVLDPLAPELQKSGLTRIDLQTRLENRLRDAQIPVDPSAAEFLGLRITSVRGNRGPFAAAFQLALYQPVVLVRDRNSKSASPTWDVETVVMADPKVLQQAANDSIDDLAGRFVTAWRSVNPR